MAMFFTETVEKYPELPFCLESPAHEHVNVSASSNFTIEGNLSKEFGRSTVCQIRNNKTASFLLIDARKERNTGMMA
jgi:hypothetical protein